ncbi:hypothetical protein [Octadecabacter sp. R77987]|uniref:hypothetical protein n=1 Tax=Octadecabacter sp. R77987 TaxID=3093874 RepID=UPI00366B31A6
MEYRGHILLVFGLSLMLSPLAIKLVMDHEAAEVAATTAPGRLTTKGAADQECDRSTIETAIGRIGCGAAAEETPVRRIDQSMGSGNTTRRAVGGATFVTARP